ncbi:NAD(P)H:quinone oxidoreductase [Aureimonas leprariae]|uniref:NAD(P)H:quinone oxidoreductase n=1 Tax=Plantimonas leprariae TaxID=2615207 RepID=A0A7V7TV26_9HYPH|nr:NAD(P)H:quinone oxidoreductase [Aureimonas leprariae]KAB0677166.1 NAD(P)H:quinone oxidoreductase [Aureimonas leprariae]
MPAADTTGPTRLLVVYYSRNGSVEKLAEAAAAAAREAGAEVRVRRAREVADAETMRKVEGWAESAARQNALYEAPSEDDAEWADAILFGTPSYFGAMATELKNFLDRLGPQWKKGSLSGKVGGAFATASWPHGGSEVVTLSLYAPMAHLGMVILPTGYTDEAMLEAGSPYGASAIVGAEHDDPREADFEAARHQGRRTVAIAAALVAAGEMPSRKPKEEKE